MGGTRPSDRAVGRGGGSSRVTMTQVAEKIGSGAFAAERSGLGMRGSGLWGARAGCPPETPGNRVGRDRQRPRTMRSQPPVTDKTLTLSGEEGCGRAGGGTERQNLRDRACSARPGWMVHIVGSRTGRSGRRPPRPAIANGKQTAQAHPKKKDKLNGHKASPRWGRGGRRGRGPARAGRGRPAVRGNRAQDRCGVARERRLR